MNVQLGDITVACTVVGDGPPVVLVHGLAEGRQSWSEIQQKLHGYRSYAYDLRGHGETSLGENEGTLAQLGGDLVGFLETQTGPAACVGYSLGGMIVLWAACKRPDLVRQVVVSATSSVVGRSAVGFFHSRLRAIKEDFAAFALDLRSDTAAQLARAGDQLDVVVQRRLAAVGTGAGYVNAAQAMIRVAEEAVTPLLHDLKCPVGVIQGEKDAFCPRKAADILLGAMPRARYQEIPDSGHLISIDQPQAYVHAIQTFLDERSHVR